MESVTETVEAELQVFHDKYVNDGEIFRHYSDKWLTAVEARKISESRITVNAWLGELVPEGLSAQCVAKCHILLASMTHGRLVRKPQGSWSHTPTDRTKGIPHKSVEMVVHDTWLPYEIEAIGHWSDEGGIGSHTRAVKTGAVVGSGTVGALDGLITAPWIAFKEWDRPREWSDRSLVMMRLLTGLGFGMERSVQKDLMEDWCSADRELLIAYSQLDNLRHNDRDRYVAWITKQIVSLFASWGPAGWLYHELESGDLNHPDNIVSERAVWLMDKVIDRAVESYKHTYGQRSK